MEDNVNFLKWQAPLYINNARSKKWFIVAGIFIGALALGALMLNDWTFSMALVIMAGVYYLVHHDDSKIVDVSLNEFGIVIDKKFYPFTQMKGFFIVWDGYRLILNFRSNGNTVLRDVQISLENTNPHVVREFFAFHVKEWTDFEESLSEKIIRTFNL